MSELESIGGAVTWTTAAKQNLSPRLIARVEAELLTVYSAASIVIKQRFRGFSDQPDTKIILAIETSSEQTTHANIIKIGSRDEVEKDFTGWQASTAGRFISSRMFFAPELFELDADRVAIVYSDAFHYYLGDESQKGPRILEQLVKESIELDRPTSSSVERVITQVLTEAHRCFYQFAHVAEQTNATNDQTRKLLRLDHDESVLDLWQKKEMLPLRRSADWLACGIRKPENTSLPSYIDPVDFLRWLLPNDGPHMLIGPSHGDLHSRNILAGVVRGEAEWPAVFDFDKMSPKNLVALDFAKLEVELKCRVFANLLDSAEQRTEIRQLLEMKQLPELPDLGLDSSESRIARQAEKMAIMFAIEQRLQLWCNELATRENAEQTGLEFTKPIPLETALGRGLRIIFRIRREAAVYLGYIRQRSRSDWQEELNCALTLYGVSTIKWHKDNDFAAWALITAGSAAARLKIFPWQPSVDLASDVDSVASYLELLPWTDHCWEEERFREPLPLLEKAIERFPYAVLLRQQRALLLSQSDSYDDEEAARLELKPLARLACVFRDHETLCRLGRIFKDQGDRAYKDDLDWSTSIADSSPIIQHYQAAFKHYETAYQIRQDYYPAINAATLALLTGDQPCSSELARFVISQCGNFDTDRPDHTWVLLSEGEARLLLGESNSAVHFYEDAFRNIDPSDAGVIRSVYDQLCRIAWAMGADAVQPVLDMLNKAGKLPPSSEPGPCGNCGR